LGIATPRTFAIEGSAAETAKGLPYPVILKPAVNQHFFPQTSLKALPVDSEAEFSRAYGRIRAYIPDQEILIQERIPGGGEHQFSFAALAAKGHVYASLVARRTRQYPVDFGSASSFVETIDQPVIAEHGRRFLEAIGLDGMAEVEFKFDTRDGQYKILDVNPRPWGWHRLGAAAGIDFPYLLWQQKTGAPPAPVGDVRSAAWFRELNDFIAIAQSPNRAAAIGGLLKAFARRRFAMATFDWRDPVPFFAEFALRASRGGGLQQQARDVLTDS
jgi:predicted ATP-grasp superfamily ATP-dependent carboligase